MTNEEQKAYDLTVENHERAMDRVAELEREVARLNREAKNDAIAYRAVIDRQDELRAELAALKAQPGGVVLPDRLTYSQGVRDYVDGWGDCLDEVASLNQQPASGGVDERAPLATLERFVETVRECYHLASSYSGCLDNVDEHGGDDHEDPICAVFHRLYYAMFDGDKALEQARAALAQSERVPEGCQLVPVEQVEVVGWRRLDRPYELTAHPSVCAMWHGVGYPVQALYTRPATVPADCKVVPVELLEDLFDLASDAVEHHRAVYAGYKIERQANMDETIKAGRAILEVKDERG